MALHGHTPTQRKRIKAARPAAKRTGRTRQAVNVKKVKKTSKRR